MSRAAYVNGGVLPLGHLEAATLHHLRIQEAGGIQPLLVAGPARSLVAEAAAVIRPYAVRQLAHDQHVFLFNVNPLGRQHLLGRLPGDGTGALHVHLAHGPVHIGIVNDQLPPFVQVQLERKRRKPVGLHLVRIIGLDVLQDMVIPFPVSFKGRPVLERYVNHVQLSGRLGLPLVIGAQGLPCGARVGGIPGIHRPAHGQAGELRPFPGRGSRRPGG